MAKAPKVNKEAARIAISPEAKRHPAAARAAMASGMSLAQFKGQIAAQSAPRSDFGSVLLARAAANRKGG